MKYFVRKLAALLFGKESYRLLIDWRFWLLILFLNIGANLGYDYLFSEQYSLIIFFILLLPIVIIRKKLCNSHLVFLICFCLIFLIQYLYLDRFSLTTTIHYILKITTSVMLVAICGDKFPRLFATATFVFSIVSLVCYFQNCLGIVLPYYPIDETQIDSGHIMRVYNLFYTQIYDPAEGTLLLRNCGPFWEPGAFQGFLNLSIWFEITTVQKKDSAWRIRLLVMIVSMLTTFSTGGYVVFFVLLLYYIIKTYHRRRLLQFVIIIGYLALSLFCYYSIDFLGDKIDNDSARLSFSFRNFPNYYYALFGYGYDVESFETSSIQSASSIFGLFRYLGIAGFLCYSMYLLVNKCNYRYTFFVIILLILMNEPFLNNSPIWWAMPFVYHRVRTHRTGRKINQFDYRTKRNKYNLVGFRKNLCSF